MNRDPFIILNGIDVPLLPQVLLILASIVAITVYRLAAFFAFSARLRAQELEPLKEYVTPQMATSVTASLISFVVIMILNTLYERVAIWITDFGRFGRRVGPSGLSALLTASILSNCDARSQSFRGPRRTTRTV